MHSLTYEYNREKLLCFAVGTLYECVRSKVVNTNDILSLISCNDTFAVSQYTHINNNNVATGL